MKELHKIAVLLGANLGNEEEIFDFASQKLSAGGLRDIVRSSIYITSPVDCVANTPDFHNQALTGYWQGTPQELLALTQAIEISAGRPAQHSSREARKLDCDIILFDNETVEEKNLQIPHPRAKARSFVLEPLAEIAGTWTFPDGESVAEAAQKLKNQSV